MNEDILNTSIRKFLKTVGGIDLSFAVDGTVELE